MSFLAVSRGLFVCLRAEHYYSDGRLDHLTTTMNDFQSEPFITMIVSVCNKPTNSLRCKHALQIETPGSIITQITPPPPRCLFSLFHYYLNQW